MINYNRGKYGEHDFLQMSFLAFAFVRDFQGETTQRNDVGVAELAKLMMRLKMKQQSLIM